MFRRIVQCLTDDLKELLMVLDFNSCLFERKLKMSHIKYRHWTGTEVVFLPSSVRLSDGEKHYYLPNTSLVNGKPFAGGYKVEYMQASHIIRFGKEVQESIHK